MKKTIAKVMAFTMLAATLAGCSNSNSGSTGSTAAPDKARHPRRQRQKRKVPKRHLTSLLFFQIHRITHSRLQ